MTFNPKSFVIEKDIFKIAGEEAIKNVSRGGNNIYLNIAELEKLAEKEENKENIGPFSETLKYINKFNFKSDNNKNFINLENGGKIFLEEEENKSKEITHLTFSHSTTSRLKRKHITTENPLFLHFGPELIDKGIIKLEDSIVKELENNQNSNLKSIENPYNSMTMKQYFSKNPKLLKYLKTQEVDEYFINNSSLNKTSVSTFSKTGPNLIKKALKQDIIKKKVIIKKGLSDSQTNKKIVSLYQTLLQPFKEFETNLQKKKLNFNLESIINITNDEYYNNQVLRIGNDYYNIKNTLIEHTHKDYKTGRYSINEDIPATVELINLDIQKKTSLKSFKPRNIEQIIGFQQILDTNIEINLIEGGSGSGKTVIAYAAALELLLQSNTNHDPKYDGIILFKSNDIIGGAKREMGFLPGSAYEKVKPFMKSFEDAHNLLKLNEGPNGIEFREMLAHPRDEKDEFGLREKHKVQGMGLPKENRAIEIEHLQFARGRTFENKIIFVDETQNYSPYEIKQLIERVGIGCKIMLVGDAQGQIDNPLLNQNFNGLTYSAAVNAYNKHPRFSMIKLLTNYRSQSAEIMRNQKGIGQ